MSFAGIQKFKELLDGKVVQEKKFAWFPVRTTTGVIWLKPYWALLSRSPQADRPYAFTLLRLTEKAYLIYLLQNRKP